MTAASGLVEVLFVHATRPGEECTLRVAPTSTIGQLKQELLKAVGRAPGRGSNVRLASRSGNTFSYYNDKELLGSAREIVVLGLTLNTGTDDGQQSHIAKFGYATVPVTIWLDNNEASVTLDVPETSTLREVKDKLAARLQRPEIAREGHFAPLEDEACCLEDSEPLRGRWRLKLLGLDQPALSVFTAWRAPASPAVLRGTAAASSAASEEQEQEALLALLPCLRTLATAPKPKPLQRPGAAVGEARHADLCRCPQCQSKPTATAARGPLELLAERLPADAVLEWPLGNGGLPKVTALIATHHGRLPALRDAVASVLGQGYAALELIVVAQDVPMQADAEHLAAVRAEAFARLPPVRVLAASAQPPGLAWSDEWAVGGRNNDERKPHRAAFVRNAGLAAATGEYVAFLDDDDVWLPGKLAKFLEEMRREECGFAASDALTGPLKKLRPFWPTRHAEGVQDRGFAYHNREKHRQTLTQRVPKFNPDKQCEVMEEQLRCHNLIITSTVVLSRDLLSRVGFMSTEAMWEDYDFWVRATMLEGRVLYLPQAWAVYDEQHGARA